MQNTSLNSISQLIQERQPDDFLKRFKIFYPKSLFPPSFSALQQGLCPFCGRKLYLNRQKTIARCKSKIGDKFVITTKRLLQLGGSIKSK